MNSLAMSRDCIECDATGCGKPGPPKRCARCHTSYYCDAKCQRAHWAEHKHDCRSVQTVRDGIIGLGKAEAPSETSSALNEEEDGSCCYVCLDEPPKDPYRVPNCGHVFCFDCLRKWQTQVKKDPSLNPNRSCPACRGSDAPDLEKSSTERAMLFATRASNAKGIDDEEREECRQKALAELDRVADSDIAQIKLQTLITRGEILSGMGLFTESIKAYEEIIKLCEEGAVARVEVDALVQQLDTAVAAGMNDIADGIAAQMEVYIKAGKFKYADFPEQEVIATHLTIAEHMEELQDWDGALNIYMHKVMAVLEYDTHDNPKNFTAVTQRRMYMGMSRCFYHQKELKKSIQCGESAIEMNRHFPQVHKHVALAQKASGDMEAALRTMARAVHYETPWDDANKKEVLEMYETLKNENNAES